LFLGKENVSSGEGHSMREGLRPSQFATPFHGRREQGSRILLVAGEGGQGVGVVIGLLCPIQSEIKDINKQIFEYEETTLHI
jgi:hypothetical protein